MEYRKLGDTDVDVSVICLGTMTFGQQNTQAEGHAQLDLAVESGVNFIDTAEIYPSPMQAETYGGTERVIGEWLKKRGKRDDVIIASKIAGPAPDHPTGLAWIRGGKTRHDDANIAAAVEDSLNRLQTDYIDLYQLHWPDRNVNVFGNPYYQHDENETMTPLAETLAALANQVKAGKIRYVGLSNETPWGLAECLRLAADAGLPRMVSVQNVYSLLNRTYEIGMAEMSVRERCGLLPYSPLGFGVLSGKYLGGKRPEGARLTVYGKYYQRYTTDKAEAAVADYAALAAQRGVDMAQMAIAFTVQQPFVTSSIIGATSLPQLKNNIAAADLVFDDGWRRDFDALGKKHFNPCP